jgi:DNA-binding SARP family transcriptional activator
MLLEKDPECFPDASGAVPHLAVLGPAKVTLKGKEAHLSPMSLAVLLRLALACGAPVSVEEIFREVWEGSRRSIGRDERTMVQKKIRELRRVLDGHGAGPNGSVIQTERGRVSAYRLTLSRDQVDFRQFRYLVEQAGTTDSITAVDLLRQALELWRGRPLPEVEHLPFGATVIHQLTTLWENAVRALVYAYRDVGRPADALKLGTDLVANYPDDAELKDLLGGLRDNLRQSQRGIIRRTIDCEPPATLVVVSGDIFAEQDAHLVIGFTDTFDTDTDEDVVISSSSLQAQAMRVMFGGDRALLDRQLRAALRDARRGAGETRLTKKRGKLIRYAVGTVATLNHAHRRVFAVAYSRMGNDLIARATLDDITMSLDRLWDAIYQYGHLRPVAIPLIGNGLARVDRTSPGELLKLIGESFIARTYAGRICPELRIVVRPADLAHVDLQEVAGYFGTLSQRRPHSSA